MNPSTRGHMSELWVDCLTHRIMHAKHVRETAMKCRLRIDARFAFAAVGVLVLLSSPALSGDQQKLPAPAQDTMSPFAPGAKVVPLGDAELKSQASGTPEENTPQVGRVGSSPKSTLGRPSVLTPEILGRTVRIGTR